MGAAPQLLFIPDRDGDDEPDGPAEVVLDGLEQVDSAVSEGYQSGSIVLNLIIGVRV